MENIQNIPQQQEQEESFDYKALFFKLYRYWYFFVLTVFIALLIAFLFNKYTKPVYEVNTTVLVKDDKSSPDAQALMGFGFGNSQQNLENEIGILQSYSLVNAAVRELDLGISYFQEENFITSELYKDSPFVVLFDSSFPQAINVKFKLDILSDKNFNLKAEGKAISHYDYQNFKVVEEKPGEGLVEFKIDSALRFGQFVSSKHFKFKIELNEKYKPETDHDKSFYFVFNDIDKLTKSFSAFEIEPIKEESSILKITQKGNNVIKSIDFLNKLTEVYLRRNLEQKNRAAENTVRFINTQLIDLSDSLNISEQSLQDFRTDKQVMDLDFQANQVYDQLKVLENEKAQLSLKAIFYKTLREYLIQNKDLEDVLIIPTTMGIDDPLISSLTTELSKYYAEKEEKLLYSNSSSPGIQLLDKKIEITENTLLENVNNIINNSNIAIEDINQRIEVLDGKISQLPATQRELLGIQRTFTLSNTMYNYLQEKRSEALITKASNEPDNEVIDIARDLGEFSCISQEKPELYDCHRSWNCIACYLFSWKRLFQ